jgi:hypothetical protein
MYVLEMFSALQENGGTTFQILYLTGQRRIKITAEFSI